MLARGGWRRRPAAMPGEWLRVFVVGGGYGMFWTIGQFPELDHLDAQQRRAVLAQVPWWTYPVMVSRAILLGTLLGVAGGMLVSAWARSRVVGVGFVPVGVLVAVVDYLGSLRRTRMAMRGEIVAGFRDQRPPFCFECGYDLRGSDAGRCPECGWAIPRAAVARGVRAADVGAKTVILGELGRAVGEEVTIRGRKIRDGGRGDLFLVEAVDGRRLEQAVEVEIRGIAAWAEHTVATLRGCEIGTVRFARGENGNPRPSAECKVGQRILLTFEVREVVEPAGLVMGRV